MGGDPLRDHIVIGDVDDCFMELSREDAEFHIEIGSPVASYHAHLTADDLRDLAEAIMEMVG